MRSKAARSKAAGSALAAQCARPLGAFTGRALGFRDTELGSTTASAVCGLGCGFTSKDVKAHLLIREVKMEKGGQYWLPCGSHLVPLPPLLQETEFEKGK